MNKEQQFQKILDMPAIYTTGILDEMDDGVTRIVREHMRKATDAMIIAEAVRKSYQLGEGSSK